MPYSHNLMNTKVLIETLTEMPDLELLCELEQNLKSTGNVNVPDLKKLFLMFNSLLKHRNKPTILKALLMVASVSSTLLATEIEILWRQVGAEVVGLGGVEDEEVRKKGKETLFHILNLSKNALMVLQTLFYSGLENQSSLVTASSIQAILKIFEEYPNLLQKKSNIPIIKLTLERIIQLTFKPHVHLNTNARDFLHALFYLNFANLHEVLQRMDSAYLKALEKIWEKDKEKLIYKEEQSPLKGIQYQHLPMIKDKIFGVYEPFVIKNLFSFETNAANRFAVQEFQRLFMENEDKLIKYVNLITKIIIKLLPSHHIEALELFLHILQVPGICNIINLSPLLDVLLPQLSDPSVPYRRLVRECLQRLNTTAKNVLQAYNRKLNEIDRNNQQGQWIIVYQLLQLVMHWMQVSQPSDCYPPALNDALIFAFNKRAHKTPKIKEKCADFLFNLLERYPSYRQTLQDVLTPEQMGQLQDEVEQRHNYKRLNASQNKQAKDTFIQEYNEERSRYMRRK